MGRAITYTVAFTLLDLALYFAVVVVQTALVRQIPLSEAVVVGGYAVAWRVLSLQVFVQVILLGVVSFFQREGNIVLTMASAIAAFLLCSTIYLGSVERTVRLFTISIERRTLNDGLVLVVSLVLTWLVMSRLTPMLSRSAS